MVASAIMTIFFFYLFFEGGTTDAMQLRKSESHAIKEKFFVSASLIFMTDNFFLFLSASICEGCPVYVAGGAPVSGGVW